MNMMIKRLFVFGCLFLQGAMTFAANETHSGLREELLQMAARDQEIRSKAMKGDFSGWAAVDGENLIRLRQIVKEFGWPTTEMVGQDGANAAWLLAQHADSDRAFQMRVLELMEPLVQQNKELGKNFAYLYDRTHYPQRFGTQGTCVSRTEWRPFEIADIANVDERRRKVNLPPLKEYASLFKISCSNSNITLHSPADTKQTVAVP